MAVQATPCDAMVAALIELAGSEREREIALSSGQSPCLSVWPPSDRTVAACDTLLIEGLEPGAHPDPTASISRIPMAKAFCFEEHGP